LVTTLPKNFFLQHNRVAHTLY